MPRRYLRALYAVEAANLGQAGREIALGQSTGNPYIKATQATRELARRYQADWVVDSDLQQVVISWPTGNFSRKDGLNHLMSVLLGGQCDIDHIQGCRLIRLDLPPRRFPGPRYGLVGLRELTGAYDRPLLGSVIKPKIGLSPNQLASVCHQLAVAGIDFIKEDEILGDPPWCPLERRVPAVREALGGTRTLYAPCLTSDGSDVLRRARKIKKLGATALHVNLWCGLGTYLELRRKQDLPIFFQKSGDKVWTTGGYSLSTTVLYQLAAAAGCDMGHIGMYGGYMAEQEQMLRERIEAFRPALPSFSCGMTPTIAGQIVRRFGNDVMLTSGGYLHGYPGGVRFAVQQFKEATGHATVQTR